MAYLSPMINTETNSSTFYLLFEDSTTGPMIPRTDSGLTFTPTANLLGVGGITVTNTSTVVNLNADMLDGQHSSYFATSSHTHSYLPLSGGTLTGSLNIGGGLTVGSSITNSSNFLTLSNPGIGYGNGFAFTRGTDAAGINVIETGSDATMYEIWMADNPDGGDMMQWRFNDWQNTNGLMVPIQTTGRNNRYVASSHGFYGNISQQTSAFYTTSNFGGTNGSNNQLIINNLSKIRVVGSTIDLTAFNVNNFTGSDGIAFWIKLDTTTTFAWGYGSTGGTPTESGISLSTSEITLANGIKVTFNTTTGNVGDLFFARIWKNSSNTFGSTTISGSLTANSIIKSGGTSSQFLKADGSVDSNTYSTTSHNHNGTYAPVSHVHGNITNAGAIGTTSDLLIKTTTNGVLTTLSAGVAGQFLQYDGTWAMPNYGIDIKYSTNQPTGQIDGDIWYEMG